MAHTILELMFRPATSEQMNYLNLQQGGETHPYGCETVKGLERSGWDRVVGTLYYLPKFEMTIDMLFVLKLLKLISPMYN